MGCTLDSLADVILGFQSRKQSAGGHNSVPRVLIDASLAAATATKRMCQWAVHAENRRNKVRLRRWLVVWMTVADCMKRQRSVNCLFVYSASFSAF
jgi:hypothetical protein